MKKKINKDKEFLAEVITWAEKTWATLTNRYPRPATPSPTAAAETSAAFDALRAKIAAWEKEGCVFPVEEDIKKNKFSRMEIQSLYICLYNELIERRNAAFCELIKVISQLNSVLATDVVVLYQPMAPLLQSGIMTFGGFAGTGMPYSAHIHPLFLRKAMGYRPAAAKTTAAAAPAPALTAKAIHSKLCETVVGQEEAKKRVAAAVFRHLKACQLNAGREPADRIQKANILIIGPTGTGKTHIARALSNVLKVPFVACDATQYTESGYVGMNVEDMLVRLQREAGGAEKMQSGVIYIDEIDKIASRDSRTSHYTTKDVSGLSVQQELLKMLDGDVIHYTRRNGITEGDYEFKVGGILFVAGGAFQGLEEIVKARLNRKAAIGFNGALEAARVEEELKNDTWYRHITTEDLIEYGFIPEFIGRFASIVTLDPLNEGDVLDILTKPKNSLLSQYEALLGAAGVKRPFTLDELKAVAHEAYELKTGARGLKSIMEARVAPLLFDAPPQDPPGRKAA